ncbi:MAG: hypothetical protein IPK16_30650 [Anaerolineales bacterium]|nr:hypothetical protein [Anaerolineales bacterium]
MVGNVLTALATPATGRRVTATVDAISGAALVEVVAPAALLAAIDVAPNPVTVTVGATQAFTATGWDSLGNPVVITPIWSTDAGSMVGNVLTALATPATGRRVTASVGAISGTAVVEVIAIVRSIFLPVIHAEQHRDSDRQGVLDRMRSQVQAPNHR